MRLPNSSRITIRELLTLAIYDRSRIALGAAIPIGLGVIAALLASPWYESTASILVLHGSDYLARSAANATVTDIGLEPKQILSAEAELVDNRNLLARVLDKIGVDKVYPGLKGADEERAVERLSEDIKIEPIFSAGVLRLTLRNRDAWVASTTLRAIIDLYLENRNAAVGDQKTASMTEQAEQMAAKLKDAEAALNQFGAEHGVFDMAEQRADLLKLKADLTAGLDSARAMTASRQTELATAMAQLRSMPVTIEDRTANGRVRELENAKASLLTLELRRKDLASRLSENSEDVANVDLQISTVKSFLATEPALIHDSSRNIRNPAYDATERRVASLDAEIKGLEANRIQAVKDMASVDARISALDGLGQTYDRLSDAQRAAEQALLAYQPKLNELKVDEEVSRGLASNVRVIENATMPTTRHGNRGLDLGLGLFAGMIGALAATFGRTGLREICVLPVEMEQWLDLKPLLIVGYKGPEAVK